MVNEASNPRSADSPSDSDPADVIVGDSGIIGLATTWQLLTSSPGTRVMIVEAEVDIAGHQTSHNSGALHAGIYYAPGSLKAVLCGGLMEQFCLDHDIPIDFTVSIETSCGRSSPRPRAWLPSTLRAPASVGPLANRIRGTICPVPNPSLPFLGVHLTRCITGEVWAGPNAFLALSRRTNKPWAVIPHDLHRGPMGIRRRRWRRAAPSSTASRSVAIESCAPAPGTVLGGDRVGGCYVQAFSAAGNPYRERSRLSLRRACSASSRRRPRRRWIRDRSHTPTPGSGFVPD
jgi:hypothetical protein